MTSTLILAAMMAAQYRPAVVYRYAAPVYPSGPRVVVAPQPQPTVTQATVADEAAAFLAALNAWRAAHGRHPIGWDASLASWAAANTGIHTVRAPSSSQCWAGTRSLTVALRMWQASPPHAAILLNATVAVGASPCPSGATCNAR